MDPVRIGLIGCGVIGQSHLRAATESSLTDVVALADLRQDVARKSAEEFSVPNVYAGGSELLADPNVEAVILALPTGVRTPLALEALGKGKHILVEKPVAMNAGEVRQMIAARGDRVAACCSGRYHLFPSTRAAAEVLASGKLGALRVLRIFAHQKARPKPEGPLPVWRLSKKLNGGGILVNWGCYDLDYMLGLTGWSLVPKRVLAQTWTISPAYASHVAVDSDAEAHLVAFILCEGGTVISFERGEFMPAAEQMAWQIVGENGSLRLYMRPEKDKRLYHDEASTAEGVTTTTFWQGEESFGDIPVPLVEDFARAIRENRPPWTPLERALVVQQITDAIYASSKQGQAVEIE